MGASASHMIGQKLAHYVILEKLGQGGMGAVYVAEDTRLERRVALKVLSAKHATDATCLARFERETKALASLSHPNITTVYSVEECDGLHFFTMELVEGSRLDRLIPDDGMRLGRVLEIGAALADAMDTAHRNGIVHRDLKPANVMLAQDGLVKILDFGLSKLRAEEAGLRVRRPDSDPVTESGTLIGTVPYMSPEQLHGRTADQRSDIFALGAVLYEMATGSRPFDGESPAAVISSILRDTPRTASDVRADVPARVGRLVQRCLEKDPDSRWQSAAELREELEAVSARSSAEDWLPRSVAVLPFADMSPNRDLDYLCEGVAEELIHALCKVPGLRVASRSASFAFPARTRKIRKVGRKLDVEAIVEGSVRRSGDRLRVAAELVSVADGYDLWSESYDCPMEDVFGVQDALARSVTEALQLALTPRQRRSMQRSRPRDANAYEFYLKGRRFFRQYRRRGIEFALELFQRAVDLDSEFALGYAGIADCCSFLYANAEREEIHLSRALESSRKALALDPELAEVHVARGVALSMANRPEEVRTEFETAIRLSPRSFEAHYFYARHCFTCGEPDLAIEHYERARTLRPEDYQAPLLMAQIYDDVGRPDAAEEARRSGVAVAVDQLKLNPDDTRALYMGANGLAALGETDRAIRWARRARELEPEEPMLLYNLACIYALAGRPEDALDCAEDAVRHGFAAIEWLEHDSNLDTVRDDPRMRALVERAGAQEAGHGHS